jgi:tetratricopeptide (TPR) repeat protein
MVTNYNKLAEAAAAEPNLIKRGIAFSQISQSYKGLNKAEQSLSMMQKAIEAFHSAAAQSDDAFEKSLTYAYEALCLISLKNLDKARNLVNKGIELCKAASIKPPLIIQFADVLTAQKIDEAEKIWVEISQDFHQGIIELLKEAFCTVNPSQQPPCLKKRRRITKNWRITLVGKKPDDLEQDWTLELADASELVEKDLLLKPEFLKDLLETMKDQKHYRFLRIIRSIISSENVDLTNKAIYLLLATSAEKKLKFGAMLGSLKGGSLHLIAVWPETFAQAVAANNEILFAFVTRLIKEPHWFLDVNVLTYLDSEDEVTEKGHISPDYYS